VVESDVATKKVRLTITDRESAERAIRGPHPYTHALSIRDATASKPIDGLENVPSRLALFFDDITIPRPGYTLVEDDHIHQIIRFAGWVRDHPSQVELLVHCEAGISRSTAAAFIILAVLKGPGKEGAAFAELISVRACALPNSLMLVKADRILKREASLASIAADRASRMLISFDKPAHD